MPYLLFLLGLGLLLSAPVRAQSGHLDRVLSAGELRVCIWPDYYGISYRNPNTRQLSGVDVDMARALAKDLGVELRFVDSSFAVLIDDVTQIAVPSPCSRSVSPRPARRSCASPGRIS